MNLGTTNLGKCIITALGAGSVLAVTFVAGPVTQGVPTTLPTPHAYSATYNQCDEAGQAVQTAQPVVRGEDPSQIVYASTPAPAAAKIKCFSRAADLIADLTQDPAKESLPDSVAQAALVNPNAAAWTPQAQSGAAANALGNASQCDNNQCNQLLGVEYQNIDWNHNATDGGGSIFYYASSACNQYTVYNFYSMPSGWSDQVSSSLNWGPGNCGDSYKYSVAGLPGYGYAGDCYYFYPNRLAQCYDYTQWSFSSGTDGHSFNDTEKSVQWAW